VDIDPVRLREEYDALVICTGATWPRDLKIPGRDADGIHFAMEFLQVRWHSVMLSLILTISKVEYKSAT
jgi:glutamate synthase (NADPH/NADH)